LISRCLPQLRRGVLSLASLEADPSLSGTTFEPLAYTDVPTALLVLASAPAAST
jgi:hypothetical protein